MAARRSRGEDVDMAVSAKQAGDVMMMSSQLHNFLMKTNPQIRVKIHTYIYAQS
jgi:hypothetical protein